MFEVPSVHAASYMLALLSAAPSRQVGTGAWGTFRFGGCLGWICLVEHERSLIGPGAVDGSSRFVLADDRSIDQGAKEMKKLYRKLRDGC